MEIPTNLVDWAPTLTNTAAIGPLYFHDPDSAQFPYRFYRAVIPSVARTFPPVTQ